MHIAAYKKIIEVTIPGVTQLRNTLNKKAKELPTVVKIGRTHLMECHSPNLGGQENFRLRFPIGSCLKGIETIPVDHLT